MEITKNAQLPGLEFFGQGEIGVWPCQKTAPGETDLKNCNSLAARDKLSGSGSQNGNPLLDSD
jgi:hypothetical protein